MSSLTPEMLSKTFTLVAKWIADGFIIFGGALPYVPQYLEMKRTNNSEGFSLYVCLVLLVANSLRIIFWFGRSFGTPLLLQSFLMIITMFTMISLNVKLRRKSQLIRNSMEHIFTDLEWKYFWEWSDLRSYMEFIMSFNIFAMLTMYLFSSSVVFVEGVGFISLITEAMIGVPQFIKNFSTKSTIGMSKAMVYIWLIGDTSKCIYYVCLMEPLQFTVCGLIQIMVDVSILVQCFLYRKNA